MSVIDKFMPLLMEQEEETIMSPIIQHNGINFIFTKHNNLYCILSSGDNQEEIFTIFYLFRLLAEFHCL